MGVGVGCLTARNKGQKNRGFANDEIKGRKKGSPHTQDVPAYAGPANRAPLKAPENFLGRKEKQYEARLAEYLNRKTDAVLQMFKGNKYIPL